MHHATKVRGEALSAKSVPYMASPGSLHLQRFFCSDRLAPISAYQWPISVLLGPICVGLGLLVSN